MNTQCSEDGINSSCHKGMLWTTHHSLPPFLIILTNSSSHANAKQYIGKSSVRLTPLLRKKAESQLFRKQIGYAHPFWWCQCGGSWCWCPQADHLDLESNKAKAEWEMLKEQKDSLNMRQLRIKEHWEPQPWENLVSESTGSTQLWEHCH